MGPPPTPFGGVPGINPPNFDPGTTITNAIKDMECRFSIQETSDVACTRNNFGDFAYPRQPARARSSASRCR